MGIGAGSGPSPAGQHAGIPLEVVVKFPAERLEALMLVERFGSVRGLISSENGPERLRTLTGEALITGRASMARRRDLKRPGEHDFGGIDELASAEKALLIIIGTSAKAAEVIAMI